MISAFFRRTVAEPEAFTFAQAQPQPEPVPAS
jgi:hypothetical protein